MPSENAESGTILIQVELAVNPSAEAQLIENRIIETIGFVAATNAAEIVDVIATGHENIDIISETYRKLIVRGCYERALDSFGLTEAEKKVTNLLMMGMDSAEIADILGFASGTIRNRISAILQKTGASRQGALAFKLLGLTQ